MKIIFTQSCFLDDDEINQHQKELVECIAKQFDFRDSINEKILIYFGFKSQILLRALGNTYFRDLPDHKVKILEEFKEVVNEGNIEDNDYFIYLATNIYAEDDDLFRTFTIAHELQHIAQYISNRCYFLLGRVLFFFFFKNEKNATIFKRIPFEYDARRIAKIIGIKLFNKSRVDEFLKQRSSSGSDYEQADYLFLDKINVEEDYDLIKDYDFYWNKYKNDIKRELSSINLKTKADLRYKEELLKNAYDYFVRECPGMNAG